MHTHTNTHAHTHKQTHTHRHKCTAETGDPIKLIHIMEITQLQTHENNMIGLTDKEILSDFKHKTKAYQIRLDR